MNVKTTPYRRRCNVVASTLIRHRFGLVLLLDCLFCYRFIKVGDRDYRINDNIDNRSDSYCLNDDYNTKYFSLE